jgi:hypothetical protein
MNAGYQANTNAPRKYKNRGRKYVDNAKKIVSPLTQANLFQTHQARVPSNQYLGIIDISTLTTNQ